MIQYKPKFSNQDYAEISGVLSQDQMITSLNPYMDYEFTVIAFNKVGRGHPSAPVEATTGETSKFCLSKLELESKPRHQFKFIFTNSSLASY